MARPNGRGDDNGWHLLNSLKWNSRQCHLRSASCPRCPTSVEPWLHVQTCSGNCLALKGRRGRCRGYARRFMCSDSCAVPHFTSIPSDCIGSRLRRVVTTWLQVVAHFSTALTVHPVKMEGASAPAGEVIIVIVIFISLVLSCIWRLSHPKNWDDWGFCKALPHNRASGGSVLAINLWQKITKWWVPTPYQSEMALVSSQSTPRPSYSCPANISELPIHLLAVHRSRAATWRMDSWSHDWSPWRLSIWLVFIRFARFWGKTWGRAGLNFSI